MDLPVFMQMSSWVLLAEGDSHYVPWHSGQTNCNQDPVQVPQVMKESRWCHLYPTLPKWPKEVTGHGTINPAAEAEGLMTLKPLLDTIRRLFYPPPLLTIWFFRNRLATYLLLARKFHHR
jgi:hypothetical protein